MILVGNQRGGAKDLAIHLMKPENERVDVHELRGFIGDDLNSAFMESYAISRGTHCKQHLFSLSLNPPKGTDVSTKDFEAAINQAEERLGLSGQPRAIVFHEKYGDDGQLRRHAHAVWCRINSDDMKAVQLSYSKNKLQELGRDLYIEHGWTMPRGFIDKSERDPLNFTLEEWQQSKRAGKDPKAVKSKFKDAWAISDSKASFAAALKEHGYILAKGDRRGFVAVDYKGEKYAISKYVGIKAKQVANRLGGFDDLPDTHKAREQASKLITGRLEEIKQEQTAHHVLKQSSIKAEQDKTTEKQAAEKRKLEQTQAARTQKENAERQARLRKGIPGLWDRFTGKRKKTLIKNEFEAAQSEKRDFIERRSTQEKHDRVQRQFEQQAKSAQKEHSTIQSELKDDIKSIELKVTESRDQDKETFKRKRKSSRERPRRRLRNRDGPTFDLQIA